MHIYIYIYIDLCIHLHSCLHTYLCISICLYNSDAQDNWYGDGYVMGNGNSIALAWYY